MRVPEALQAIEKVKDDPPEIRHQEILAILDAVWLAAYEEGKEGVFETPPHDSAKLSLKCRMYGDSEHTPCSGTVDDGSGERCEHWCHGVRRGNLHGVPN